MTHKIMHAGTELLRGDALSIRVIANNLTGRNFAGREDEHRRYLDYMERAFGHAISPADITVNTTTRQIEETLHGKQA